MKGHVMGFRNKTLKAFILSREYSFHNASTVMEPLNSGLKLQKLLVLVSLSQGLQITREAHDEGKKPNTLKTLFYLPQSRSHTCCPSTPGWNTRRHQANSFKFLPLKEKNS